MLRSSRRDDVQKVASWLVPPTKHVKPMTKPEDILMQTIQSNLNEIIAKCPNTYAAHVAQTTLRAINKQGVSQKEVEALTRLTNRKTTCTPEKIAGFANKPEISGDLS